MKRWMLFAGVLLVSAGVVDVLARTLRGSRAREQMEELQTWEGEGGTPGDAGLPHETGVAAGN